MSQLNPRRRAFVEAYVLGPQNVRGQGGAAYRAAGYHVRSDLIAQNCATKLLGMTVIQKEISRLHAAASAKIISRLVDWKELAPAAQQRLQLLAMRYLPDPEAPGGRIVIRTRADAAVAKVMLDVNLAILHKAYPDKLYVQIEDPTAVLAGLLGVPPSQFVLAEPVVSAPLGIQ